MNCVTCGTPIFALSDVTAESSNIYGVGTIENYTFDSDNRTPARINYTESDGLLFDIESDDPQSIVRKVYCENCSEHTGWKCTFCYKLDADMCHKFYIYKDKCTPQS